MRFGYASQNLTLGVTTGRTLRLVNVADAERVRAVVGSNLQALESILRWNAAHGIGLFRMSQQLIPFASHPAFPYDWEEEHGPALRRLGALAADLGIRLSMHPGQFIQPGSPRGDVESRGIAELRYVARLLTLLDGADLVLHLGGAFEDREAAVARFVAALHREQDVLRHLALENDEHLWTVEQVVGVAERLEVPAIVDTLHHALNPGTLSLEDALDFALPTWHRRPKVHLSSQDPAKLPGAHAWGVNAPDLYDLLTALHGRDVDVMIEAKGKEEAVLALQTPKTSVRGYRLAGADPSGGMLSRSRRQSSALDLSIPWYESAYSMRGRGGCWPVHSVSTREYTPGYIPGSDEPILLARQAGFGRVERLDYPSESVYALRAP